LIGLTGSTQLIKKLDHRFRVLMIRVLFFTDSSQSKVFYDEIYIKKCKVYSFVILTKSKKSGNAAHRTSRRQGGQLCYRTARSIFKDSEKMLKKLYATNIYVPFVFDRIDLADEKGIARC